MRKGPIDVSSLGFGPFWVWITNASYAFPAVAEELIPQQQHAKHGAEGIGPGGPGTDLRRDQQA